MIQRLVWRCTEDVWKQWYGDRRGTLKVVLAGSTFHLCRDPFGAARGPVDQVAEKSFSSRRTMDVRKFAFNSYLHTLRSRNHCLVHDVTRGKVPASYKHSRTNQHERGFVLQSPSAPQQ